MVETIIHRDRRNLKAEIYFLLGLINLALALLFTSLFVSYTLPSKWFVLYLLHLLFTSCLFGMAFRLADFGG